MNSADYIVAVGGDAEVVDGAGDADGAAAVGLLLDGEAMGGGVARGVLALGAARGLLPMFVVGLRHAQIVSGQASYVHLVAGR